MDAQLGIVRSTSVSPAVDWLSAMPSDGAMLSFTMEDLFAGATEVPAWWVAADDIWSRVMKETDDKAFAEKIGSAQFEFERRCGGHRRAQEIMGFSAISRLFVEGRPDYATAPEQARRVLAGIRASNVSGEVEVAALDAARLYQLDKR